MAQTAIATQTPTFTPTPNGKIRWTETLVYAAHKAGFFAEGDRYELIDGELWYMPPPDPIHEGTIRKLVALLRKELIDYPDVDVETGSPAGLGESDIPIPDVVVLRHDENYYTEQHPGSNDIYLIVEVANSHPERDTKTKREQYAKFRHC